MLPAFDIKRPGYSFSPIGMALTVKLWKLVGGWTPGNHLSNFFELWIGKNHERTTWIWWLIKVKFACPKTGISRQIENISGSATIQGRPIGLILFCWSFCPSKKKTETKNLASPKAKLVEIKNSSAGQTAHSNICIGVGLWLYRKTDYEVALMRHMQIEISQMCDTVGPNIFVIGQLTSTYIFSWLRASLRLFDFPPSAIHALITFVDSVFLGMNECCWLPNCRICNYLIETACTCAWNEWNFGLPKK